MSNRTLRGIIAFILVIVLIIGVFVTIAVGSAGFTNWNLSTWFSSQTDTPPALGNDDSGNQTVTDEPGADDNKDDKPVTYKDYRFEAEKAELGGTAISNEVENTRGFVGEFSNSGTVTFKISADAAVDAELKLCITLPASDTNLTDLVSIEVNGSEYATQDNIVGAGDDSTRWVTWQVFTAGTLHLINGENTLVFTGSFGGCNIDYIELSVPQETVLTFTNISSGDDGDEEDKDQTVKYRDLTITGSDEYAPPYVSIYLSEDDYNHILNNAKTVKVDLVVRWYETVGPTESGYKINVLLADGSLEKTEYVIEWFDETGGLIAGCIYKHTSVLENRGGNEVNYE